MKCWRAPSDLALINLFRSCKLCKIITVTLSSDVYPASKLIRYIKTSSWIPTHTLWTSWIYSATFPTAQTLFANKFNSPVAQNFLNGDSWDSHVHISAGTDSISNQEETSKTNWCCSCRELQFPKYANKSKRFWRRRQSSPSPIRWCLVCEYYRKSILQTCYTNKFIISRTVMGIALVWVCTEIPRSGLCNREIVNVWRRADVIYAIKTVTVLRMRLISLV